MFWFFGWEAYGIIDPWPGIDPARLKNVLISVFASSDPLLRPILPPGCIFLSSFSSKSYPSFKGHPKYYFLSEAFPDPFYWKWFKPSLNPCEYDAVSAHLLGQWMLCVVCVCARLCSAFCDPVDCSPPGSSVHGILQARPLEWVAISYSRGSSWPRDQTCVSCTARQGLYH